MTADDFVEGLRYVADPKNGIKNLSQDVRKLGRRPQRLLPGPLGRRRRQEEGPDPGTGPGKLRSKVGITAPDKYTLVYKLSKPTPFFLSYLVMELFLPVEKEFLDSVGLRTSASPRKSSSSPAPTTSPTGSATKQIVLKANPHYWDAGKISVKTISLQKVVDPTSPRWPDVPARRALRG
ncbi:MAG: ABC transporter substrate-binding protein [Chromatiales bacterium]|nr:ABC transporter substrate-binding protein [Chromatiales bacterium]